MRLSVIVPVRDGERYLRQLLASLERQRCDFEWELIVVDNGSTDRSAQTARSFGARIGRVVVLAEPRAGKANALNAGVAAASGSLLLFLDADDEVGDGYLQAMADALEEHDIVRATLDTARLNPPWARQQLLPDDRLAVHLGFLPYIPGGMLAIRADACSRVGPFSAEVLVADDVDFSWRAHLLGLRAGVVPGAVLHYRRPAGARECFRKARGYGRSHVALYVRYRARGQPRRTIRQLGAQLLSALGEVYHHEEHWTWRLAWEIGPIVGRLEESLRRRVWYP